MLIFINNYMPILTLKRLNDIIAAVETDYKTMYSSTNIEVKRTGFVGLVALKKVRELIMRDIKKN
ncbi:hypothetical protein CL634_07925 [bacterium]|nr:hypothetical protein [bacterium]